MSVPAWLKYTWTSWAHETGDVHSYSHVSDPLTWVSFELMHEAGNATFRAQVNSYLEGGTSVFMQGDPELSNMPAGMRTPPAMIEVTHFKLKPGQRQVFMDTAGKI